MTGNLIIVFLVVVFLLPESELTFTCRYFDYNYSRKRLFKRHKDFFNVLFKKAS